MTDLPGRSPRDGREMTEEEMVERIAKATWTADDRRRFGHAPDDVRRASVTDFVSCTRAAGFEVIDKEELAVLRASQVPSGWVCVDPDGKIDMDAEDAADAKVYITPGARYLDNTDDVIRAYLRAVRDKKELGE